MYKELAVELRTISAEIEEYNKNNPRGEQLDAQIVDVIRMVDRMAWICRKEGLLRLEEELYKPGGKFPCEDVWKQIITLVVDGADPELIHELAVSRYYALNLHAHDALAVMIYMESARNLQKGVNPRVIEELVLALVPSHIEKEYRELAEREKKESWYRTEVHEQVDMTTVDKVCSESHSWSKDEEGYFLIKLFEIVMSRIDDRATQRILRDVDNTTLTKAMKGLDENTKRKFFNNLSERLAVMIAEDMIVRGDVRITDVVKAVQEILVVILKLMSTGEVADTGFAFYDKMMDIFEIDKPSPNQIDYDMAVAELRALFNEYNQGKYKRI